MFSKRSKSADSSVGSAGERTRNNSKEFTEENVTKAEERVNAVGEVTGLLEKSKIKWEELDNAIKDVFDKYVSELQPYRSFDTSFGCRTNTDFLTSLNLLTTNLGFPLSKVEKWHF